MMDIATTLGTLYTGSLVRLAAVGLEFKEARARWSNDAELMRLWSDDPAVPRSAESYEADDDRHDDGKRFEFAIRTIADDNLIGACGLWPEWNHQSAWLGIGIGESEYRGKGYGTDAMRVLVRYGFQELGLYRIQLNVLANNPRAIRSYEKVGFVREVVQRAADYRDSVRHDIYTMGLLRTDWEAANP
jgi:RimJ/RimL family protein N-acetyltransferase